MFVNLGMIPKQPVLKLDNIDLAKNFAISFKINLKKTNPSWTQILGVTTNSSGEDVRCPAVWICPDTTKLFISIKTKSNPNDPISNCEIDTELGVTNKFDIIRKDTSYSVYKNGNLMNTVILNDPSETIAGKAYIFTSYKSNILPDADISDVVVLYDNKSLTRNSIEQALSGSIGKNVNDRRASGIEKTTSVTKNVSTLLRNENEKTIGKTSQNEDVQNNLKEKSKKEKLEDKWLSIKKIPKFLEDTLSGVLQLTGYFYLGINFNLLSKSTQLNPGGLRGQDFTKEPYIGNFSECSETNFDISEPISKWSFPYKNQVICDGKAHRERPLYFRFIYWTVGILGFSYALGRLVLNKFLSISDETMSVLLGPILMLVILLFTPLVSLGTSSVGLFYNLERMLPACYYTFWYPILTTLLFLWGAFVYPSVIMITQVLTVVYFVVFHMTFNKVEILEDGIQKTSEGFMSIVKRLLKNSTYHLFILITIAWNAFNNLGLIFSIPIIGWTGFYAYTRYLRQFLTKLWEEA